MHKGTSYPGEHAAVIDRETFDRVQAILATNGRARAAATRRATPALLKGLLFAANGRAMTPAYTKKNSRLYRYYVSTDAIRGRLDTASGGSQDSEIARSDLPLRMSADMIESLVLKEIRRLLRTPEIPVTVRHAGPHRS